MRRLAVVAVSLLALASVAAAAARDPRAEQQRLTPADMKAARASLIGPGDLQPGWERTKPSSNDNSPMSCPGYNPDFSKYVITGKAESDFKHPAGAWLTSETEIYATHADATGDFRAGARPQFVTCLTRMLKQQAATTPSVRVKILRSRMLRAPGLGERAARYQAVARFDGPAQSLTMYIDLYAFQKGRLLGAVLTMSVSDPVRDGAVLARKMLKRFH